MSNPTAYASTGHLYLVGVGPGDPELMTYKAVRILRETRVWAVPKARESGSSSALAIAGQMVAAGDRTVLELCFPMKMVFLGQETDRQLLEAWGRAADEVIALLTFSRSLSSPIEGW